MVSVWVNIESFYKYKNGKLTTGVTTSSKQANINLLIPLEDVVRFYDNGKYVEIDLIKTGK